VQIDLLDAPGQHASSARGLLKPALELYRLVPSEPPTTSAAPLGHRRGRPPLRRPHLRGRAALPLRTPEKRRRPSPTGRRAALKARASRDDAPVPPLGQNSKLSRNPLQPKTLNGMCDPKNPEQRRTRKPNWPICCSGSPVCWPPEPVTPLPSLTEPSAWRKGRA
jgi:hypothetical protein